MNYMYCVVSTTPEGHPDVMKRKWRMLALHVQNIMTNLLMGNSKKRPGILCD